MLYRNRRVVLFHFVFALVGALAAVGLFDMIDIMFGTSTLIRQKVITVLLIVIFSVVGLNLRFATDFASSRVAALMVATPALVGMLIFTDVLIYTAMSDVGTSMASMYSLSSLFVVILGSLLGSVMWHDRASGNGLTFERWRTVA